MTGPDEHVFAGIAPFGLRRCRATCSCGYAATPVLGQEPEVVEEARRLFFAEHGARDLRPDEPAHAVLLGGAGLVRPTSAQRGLRPRSQPDGRPADSRDRSSSRWVDGECAGESAGTVVPPA